MLLETTIMSNERDISVRPTKITGLVKVDTSEGGPKYHGQTKPKWSVLKFQNFELNGKCPVYNNGVTIKQALTVMSFQHRITILRTFKPHANL